MDSSKVVKGVIINAKKEVALVEDIASRDKPSGFGFPGGKVEKNIENLEKELEREVEEETGLEIEILDLISKKTKKFGEKEVEIFFYLCKPLNEGINKKVDGETNGWYWFPIKNLFFLEKIYYSHRSILIDENNKLKDEVVALLWHHQIII